MNYESPASLAATGYDYSMYTNFFNLTSTYEIDSDFPGVYSMSKFKWELNENFDENQDFSSNKFFFAAAVISNCHDKANRLEYIKELRKYIQVDFFGQCGDKKCPLYYTNSSIEGDCKRIIFKEYKFFLAFENSFCKDYITEKFFHALNYSIIPVVRGHGNYNLYVPKSGYIDTFDFKSPHHLAEYLIYLDKNKTAFNSYFKWKKHIKPYPLNNVDNKDYYGLNAICDMCIYMHLEDYFGIETKIIKNVYSMKNCNNFNIYFSYLVLFPVLFVTFLIIIAYLFFKKLNC
jgi:alpha-1,3-fucosyltransferase